MNNPLFEFEDLEWFPDTIRRSMVDYLSFFLRKTDYYQPIIPLIAECLQHSDTQQIVDLCSGGGGPIPQVQKNLKSYTGVTTPILLTDKFPNIEAYEHMQNADDSSISFVQGSVDATQVPSALKGVRTSFSAFHHFQPAMAKKILKDAVDQKAPIAIFDGGDKNLITILGIMLVHPIVFVLCTPFFKPFRFSRIFFTYLVPVIPICTVWDGAVSITRLYRPKQLDALVAGKEFESYTWQSGIKRHKLGFGISYLIGYPKTAV